MCEHKSLRSGNLSVALKLYLPFWFQTCKDTRDIYETKFNLAISMKNVCIKFRKNDFHALSSKNIFNASIAWTVD